MLVCFSLLLIPMTVLAENYTVNTDNRTITIVINPNNSINIQPQNNTKLEQITQSIANKEEKPWNQGDVLISSATIVGFFSIGSFIAIRFRQDPKYKSFSLLASLIVMNAIIISFHLSFMLSIVYDKFNPEIYFRVVVFTIGAVFYNASAIIRINYYENRRRRGATKASEFKKLVEDVEKALQNNIKKDSSQKD